jgi:hypothetical protein
MKKYLGFLYTYTLLSLPAAQAQVTEPETVVVIAGNDPVIAAIRADALDHKGKVVAQTCIMNSEDKDGKTQTTETVRTDGPDAFKWQMTEMRVDGVLVSDKKMQKVQKKRQKRQEKNKENVDEGYEQFADLIADKDRIEKLPAIDGLRRYRINRLPDSIAKDLPDAIAKRLKPVLWIADAEGEPYVKRLEVSLGDFRMYVIAKIKSADFDMYFERRDDGFVKERSLRYDMNYSIFGSDKFGRGEVTCDAGGPVVIRPPKQANP